MIARPIVALALLALLLGPAAADEPKAFACSFTAGVTHAYDKGNSRPRRRRRSPSASPASTTTPRPRT
jgi:hypothetical protein